MHRRMTTLLVLPLLAACDGLPTSPEPELETVCVAAVRLGGLWYGVSSDTISAAVVSSDVFGTALREVTCNDTLPLPDGAITDHRDGDVVGFALGTTFHAVEGFEPSQRLAVMLQGAWVILRPT